MTRTRSLTTLCAMAVSALAIGGAAKAQFLGNHNSNAPVNFSADRIEVQDRADRVVVSGNVVVDQAGLTLRAARMTVAYKQAGSVEVQRIDASGNVVVTRGSETARGNVGIYDLNRRLITMLGNVQLDQGSNHLTGGRLVMDLASGRSTVDGRSAGGAPGSVTGSSGRVSGTFTVPQRTNKP
ncbi:MAG: LptA/OstA family protein [Sphingobium sp.]